MTRCAPMCYSCKRFDPDTKTCTAFPDGIPDEILRGDFDHRKSFKGDQGILFDPISPEALDLVDFVFENTPKEEDPPDLSDLPDEMQKIIRGLEKERDNEIQL